MSKNLEISDIRFYPQNGEYIIVTNKGLYVAPFEDVPEHFGTEEAKGYLDFLAMQEDGAIPWLVSYNDYLLFNS
jgi:hypothetical protein